MTMKMAKVRDCNATDGIISKPFDIEILLSKIKELLDKLILLYKIRIDFLKNLAKRIEKEVNKKQMVKDYKHFRHK